MEPNRNKPTQQIEEDKREQVFPASLPAKPEPIKPVIDEIYKHEFGLSEEDRIRLRSITADIKSKFRVITKDKLAVGLLMVEAKNILPHGDFEGWCSTDLGVMARSAQRYMSVVERFANYLDQIEHLQISLLHKVVEKQNWELMRDGVMSELASGKPLTAEDLHKLLPEKKSASATPKEIELPVADDKAKLDIVVPDVSEIHAIDQIATYLKQCEDDSLQTVLRMDCLKIGEMLIGNLLSAEH